jgi:hypothetical protein
VLAETGAILAELDSRRMAVTYHLHGDEFAFLVPGTTRRRSKGSCVASSRGSGALERSAAVSWVRHSARHRAALRTPPRCRSTRRRHADAACQGGGETSARVRLRIRCGVDGVTATRTWHLPKDIKPERAQRLSQSFNRFGRYTAKRVTDPMGLPSRF